LRESTVVAIDLDYYNSPPNFADRESGRLLSHFGWELNNFGIEKESLYPRYQRDTCLDYELLGKSGLPIALRYLRSKGLEGILGTKKHHFLSRYRGLIDQLPEKYVALHLRQGDYLNVASFIIRLEQSLTVLKSVLALVPNLVVLSDSDLADQDIERLQNLGCGVSTLIGGSATAAMYLMHEAEILIAANSQLSFAVAAMRASDKLTIVPNRFWENKPDSLLIDSTQSLYSVYG
jgi:hypothetical protein